MTIDDITGEDIALQLDQDLPHWVTTFADARSLQEYATGAIPMSTVRSRVINSTLWPILRATYCLTKI